MSLSVIIFIAAMNAFAFLLFGYDKSCAVRGAWRVPEGTLLSVALLGGSVGALAGMYVFRHKTKKAKFTIGVPLILLCHAAAVLLLFSNR